MASLLCKGAQGMIVMIDNGSDNPIAELDYYLKLHSAFLKNNPALIAVTHYDDTCTCTGLIDYHQYCIAQGFSIPVLRVDARKKEEIERTLQRLLTQIDNIKQRPVKSTPWQIVNI
jgi:signal recognition particle receptor subunit beta